MHKWFYSSEQNESLRLSFTLILVLYFRTTAAPSVSTLGGKSMNYRQLEEQINKWMLELEDQERMFLQQATQVNAWDRLLVDNGEKVGDSYQLS